MKPDTLWELVARDGTIPIEHIAPLRYLIYSTTPYPSDAPTYAWKRPKSNPPTRKLAVARFTGENIEVYAEGYHRTGPIEDTLLSPALHGHIIVFQHGARQEFHTLYREHARRLVGDGYTLCPIVASSEIRANRVQRSKLSWWLCDSMGVCGLDETDTAVWWEGHLRHTHRAYTDYQLLVEGLGGYMSITTGGTAIRTAARHLPSGDWMYRPLPLAVTMCREGHGFMGGYQYVRSYKGTAYKYDQNRAYLCALQEGIPLRRSFSRCLAPDGSVRRGVFLCTVRGPGLHPIYLSPWRNGSFQPERNWNGDQVVCVLPSSEFQGIRDLGYTVEPSWGVAHIKHTSINTFIAKLSHILNTYPRDSWQSKAVKPLGNAIYGKFAEGSTRDILRYDQHQKRGYLPFMTPEEVCVPDLWVTREYVNRPHQQVDAAAMVTGHVRGKLYSAMAHEIEMGNQILMADTDSFTSKYPATTISLADRRLGGWRLEDSGDTTIVAERVYRVGGTVRDVTSGTRNPQDIELHYDGTFEVHRQRLAAPWR